MRWVKSDDLLHGYCRLEKEMFFKRTWDSFLGVAEELQLKGLMGKSEHMGKQDQEVFPSTGPENPARTTKKDRNHKTTRTNMQNQKLIQVQSQ